MLQLITDNLLHATTDNEVKLIIIEIHRDVEKKN